MEKIINSYQLSHGNIELNLMQQIITSNYHQMWYPNKRMTWPYYALLEVFIDKTAL